MERQRGKIGQGELTNTATASRCRTDRARGAISITECDSCDHAFGDHGGQVVVVEVVAQEFDVFRVDIGDDAPSLVVVDFAKVSSEFVGDVESGQPKVTWKAQPANHVLKIGFEILEVAKKVEADSLPDLNEGALSPIILGSRSIFTIGNAGSPRARPTPSRFAIPGCWSSDPTMAMGTIGVSVSRARRMKPSPMR